MAARPALRCALVGNAPLLLFCGEVIRARGQHIVAVITSDAGVARWASDHDLPLLTEGDDVVAAFRDGIDLLFDIGHPAAVPTRWVERARDAIRFHPGPLPAYAGYHPTTWALLDGATTHAVTWHILSGRTHYGPIVASDTFDIDIDETTGTLDARCRSLGARSFVELFDALLDNRLAPRPQIGRKAWYAAHRSPPAAGVLDFRRPAAALARMVRALCGARRSPVAWASMGVGADAVVVERAQVESWAGSAAPGTIVRIDARGVLIAAGVDAIRVQRIWHQDGLPLRISDLPVAVGEQLPLPDVNALEALDQAWRADSALWTRRLGDADPLPVPFGEAGAVRAGGALARGALNDATLLTCIAALLARCTDRYRYDIAVTDPDRLAAVAGLEAWFCPYVPLRIDLDARGDLAGHRADLEVAWREAQRSGHRRDLAARLARRRGAVVGAVLVAQVADARRFMPPPECRVACVFDASTVRWWAPALALGPLERGFAALLEASDAAGAIADLPLLGQIDRARLEAAWLTGSQVTPLRIGDAVLGRAACTPDIAALTAGDRSLSFAQLELAVQRLARHLQAVGVDRGCRTLIALPDPIGRIIAILATMVAGGVPTVVDPEVLDSGWTTAALRDAGAIITLSGLRAPFSDGATEGAAPIICLDADRAAIDARSAEALCCPATPDDPAICLPGRTGLPVVLTHRALVGVFSSIDEIMEHRDGVWLALSDAAAPSTLIDTLWALSRGFEVVLIARPPARPLLLSVALCGADPHLLGDVARFADGQGLDGLWLMEEGLPAARLPDAAVATAAAAASTRRLPLRAITRLGPDPARALAVWRMVHGIAHGRLDLAIHGARPARLADDLSAIGALAAQDAPSLPCVVATTPAEFAQAAELGAAVVCVHGGRALGSLGPAIAAYRAAWSAAGHHGCGHVTLIAPTLIGEDDTAVRGSARRALARWLRQTSGPGPAVPLDAIAICGDAHRAALWMADIAAAGVDEIACLLDFGLPANTVRSHLRGIGAVHAALRADGPTLAELIVAHGATHLELPVDGIRRLLADDAAVWALAEVRHVILTGEALAIDNARAARQAIKPTVRITRRFAPIEAGAWCTSHPVGDEPGPTPLGRPLGHARVAVVDGRGQPVPVGAPGELCVGAIDIATPADAQVIQSADVALVRAGLRVRQTPDGVLEPAPRNTVPPTAPPPATPPRLTDVSAREQVIADALWQALGASITDVYAEVLLSVDTPMILLDVQAALQAALDRPVPLPVLFEHPSVAALAEWIDGPPDPQTPPRRKRPARRVRRRK